MAQRVEVAIGVLVEEREGRRRLLITRRLSKAVYGGYWEFPGGKIEPGETPREALAREFVEELGLTIAVGEPLAVIEHDYAHASVRLHPFLCSPGLQPAKSQAGSHDRPLSVPQNLGVAEHRWVLPEELGDYRFPEANIPMLAALAARFSPSPGPPSAV